MKPVIREFFHKNFLTSYILLLLTAAYLLPIVLLRLVGNVSVALYTLCGLICVIFVFVLKAENLSVRAMLSMKVALACGISFLYNLAIDKKIGTHVLPLLLGLFSLNEKGNVAPSVTEMFEVELLLNFVVFLLFAKFYKLRQRANRDGGGGDKTGS